MQHDNPSQTFYGWLEQAGYTKEQIDSWPIQGGFLIGDMPIVSGSKDYKVGDVIVYTVSQESYPIIHRVVKINADVTYQTKGDNNMQQFTYELAVRSSQIHGKVIFVIPKLGYLKVFATRLFGI
jgi:signal peptidase I